MKYTMVVDYKNPYDNQNKVKQYLFDLDLSETIKKPFDQTDKESMKNFIYDVKSFEIIINNIFI